MRILLTALIFALLTSPVFPQSPVYTEKIAYRIEILEDGQLQVRKATIVLKGGEEIGRRYHRHVLAPGDDVTKENKRVKAVARAVWTPEVIKEYKEKVKRERTR